MLPQAFHRFNTWFLSVSAYDTCQVLKYGNILRVIKGNLLFLTKKYKCFGEIDMSKILIIQQLFLLKEDPQSFYKSDELFDLIHNILLFASLHKF